MYPPAAVVFDLDGTLIDSRGDIVASVNHALVSTGRKPLPGQVIVRYVGDGARTLCARAAQLPEDDAAVDAILGELIAYYRRHPIDFTRWMPWAREALEAISDIGDFAMALCTNKPRPVTDAVLSALGVRSRFRIVVAGGDVPEKKPAAAPLLYAAKRLGIGPERLVMVGDGPQDVECARRAGARAIAIEGGFFPRDRLVEARPDVLLSSLSDLRDVIRRWRDVTVRAIAVRT